jgi:hypothetical protein
MIKKLSTLVLILSVTMMVNAQDKKPAPSPSSQLKQVVGLTDVTVDYSRPSMKGRKIFGGLESYGKVWRTGANARTKITFSDDVTIAGKSLKAGTYAIFTIPTATSWEVIFYTNHSGGGAPASIDESLVALRTNVEVNELPFDVESLLITIGNLRDGGANLQIIWENIAVSIPFTVPTH